MREDLLREIDAELEEQRRKNEQEEQKRRQQISEGYPVLARLMQERENLIHHTLLGILNGSGSADGLTERMERISAEIRKELEKNGFPADYLSPVYSCEACRDTGMIGETVRSRCKCVKKRYQEKLRNMIGLSGDQRETFENFREDLFPDTIPEGCSVSQRKMMRIARKVCEEWADQYPESSRRDLLLTGASGLGKTFLLRAMAARLIEREIPVILISAYDYLQLARQEYFGNGNTTEELLSAQVLMLDDLGSEPLMQNITVEQIFRLINERQNRNLATVISTNLTLEELRERYTERTVSRMTDSRNSHVIPLAGEDIRRRL